jgi:hypothetical protein
MPTFDLFAFANPWIIAAFFVAGFSVAFKVQWQGFFYLLVVIYGVSTWEQWMFCSIVYAVHVMAGQYIDAARRDSNSS